MIEYLLAFAAGVVAHSVLSGRQPESQDSVETLLESKRVDLQERYTDPDSPMDYVEFGDRIALLERPETERIMRESVTVDGVGPQTAFEIAVTFDGDYEAFREADRSAFERINGVGENRATALLNR